MVPRGELPLPRKARQKSESGIYHIIMRGINRQTIFNEDEDYHRFLQTLKYYKEQSEYQIFAYCIMNNHIHLLLKPGLEPLEQIMRRICGKFVYWYNQKYERVGYLFQDRFKSEPVEDDSYFLTALRYIHQNPLKAGLVDDIEQYPWSSYRAYINRDKLVDFDFALKIFNNNRAKALEAFIAFNKQKTDEQCMDVEENKRFTDQEALTLITIVCKTSNLSELQKLDKITRDKYLGELKQEGLSVRQIARLTGINRGVVLKA
jgi:putative transposase